MSEIKGTTFQDRQSAAAQARKAQLERFKARPAPDDPSVVARQTEHRAILEARAIRTSERETAKAKAAAEQREREIVEARLRQEAEKAEAEARELALAEEVAYKAELETLQKAERDARYAARKARKSQRKQELDRRR